MFVDRWFFDLGLTSAVVLSVGLVSYFYGYHRGRRWIIFKAMSATWRYLYTSDDPGDRKLATYIGADVGGCGCQNCVREAKLTFQKLAADAEKEMPGVTEDLRHFVKEARNGAGV